MSNEKSSKVSVKIIQGLKNILNMLIRLINWIIYNIYTILYLALIISIWSYVFKHWKKCISMQLFSKFDGNNILFIVGILLVVLPFYEIEGHGFKFHRISTRKLEDDLEQATMIFNSQMIKSKSENYKES